MPHPYGQERWANGVAVTDFSFTSQRIERGFGLMDYQARYYSPTLGRFISPDTIVPEPGSSQGWNRYAYVRNNPLNYIDPSGHCWGPASGMRNIEYGGYGYGTTCNNVDMAITIAGHSEASVRDRTLAVLYVEGLFISHAILAIYGPEVLASIFGSGDPELATPEQIEENNREVRQWYNDEVEQIPELNEGWIEEGLSAEERARRAYEIRHNARTEARNKMIDTDGVARLQERDIDKYGNPDGPTFDQLVQKAQEQGYTGDDVYESIIGSSRRTNEDVNRRFDIER